MTHTRQHEPESAISLDEVLAACVSHGGDRRSEEVRRNQVGNANLKPASLNDRTYAIRRLKRDRPDLAEQVVSANLRRRHLDESGRAWYAAKLATLTDGQRQVGKFAHVPTIDQAAAQFNVSPRLVKSARAVQQSGERQLAAQVEKGQEPPGPEANTGCPGSLTPLP